MANTNYDQQYLKENPVILLQMMDASHYENTMHVQNSNAIFYGVVGSVLFFITGIATVVTIWVFVIAKVLWNHFKYGMLIKRREALREYIQNGCQ